MVVGLCAALCVGVLLRSDMAMEAASAACRLFVRAVLPGLFPYMTLTLLLQSRLTPPHPPWLTVLLGWGGGSPGGAALVAASPGMAHPRRTALTCATMSPMFLLGTLGSWLGSVRAGVCVLAAVLAGGAVTGALAGGREDSIGGEGAASAVERLSLGAAVERSCRVMLTVCGTMVMARVVLALLTELLPGAWVWAAVLAEVTTGAEAVCGLPLPLPLRTALLSGCCGWGGMAILMQNRAVLPSGLLSLPHQVGAQLLHGALSLLIGLGLSLWLL